MCTSNCNIIKYALYPAGEITVNVGIAIATQSIHVVIESELQPTKSIAYSAIANNPVFVDVTSNSIENFDDFSGYFIIRWFGDNGSGGIDFNNQLNFKDSNNIETTCLVFRRNRKFVECFGATEEFILLPPQDGDEFSDVTLDDFSDGQVSTFSGI